MCLHESRFYVVVYKLIISLIYKTKVKTTNVLVRLAQKQFDWQIRHFSPSHGLVKLDDAPTVRPSRHGSLCRLRQVRP